MVNDSAPTSKFNIHFSCAKFLVHAYIMIMQTETYQQLMFQLLEIFINK